MTFIGGHKNYWVCVQNVEKAGIFSGDSVSADNLVQNRPSNIYLLKTITVTDFLF